MSNDDVPDLRGGFPKWIWGALSFLFGAAVATVPVIVAIARMPDGPRFDQVRDDVSAIKQKIAVMEATLPLKEKLDEQRNKAIDEKLTRLLTKTKP